MYMLGKQHVLFKCYYTICFLLSSIISPSITHMAPPLHHHSHTARCEVGTQNSTFLPVFTPDNFLTYGGKKEV